MQLKHLTISGFKSFAKKSELEFSAPITAIVGPNGSGKSNVAEAFRFVLGEQSVKSMRGKRGEDLIWGGSDAVARGNRAAVTVTLANEARVFPIDFDEITLERTVHRDGQNEYSVNGSKVRLKDVQELLAAANIGPTGHHIISQGEADRILSATPKERREMIEDALGLKVYQFKKQAAERKLQKTRENIDQVERLRLEVAPHLKFLERQVKKIERSIQLREELAGAYLEYLRREDVYIAHHHDRLTTERAEPETKQAAYEKELAAAKKTLAAAEQDEKRDELMAAEAALQTARTDRQAAVRTVGQTEGQIAFVERRLAALRNKAAEADEQPIPYEAVAKVVDQIEREVEKASKDDDPKHLKRSLADVVHSLKSFLQRLTKQSVSVGEEEEAELATLEKEKQAQDKALAEATEAETAAQAAYDAVRAAIEAEASESREAEREVFRLVGLIREQESALVTIDNELANLERDRTEFKRELQEAVALIGRRASEYYSAPIVVDDTEIGPAEIVAESRDEQRERRRALEKMKIRLEELGGANEDVEKEYKEVKERDDFLVREIADLTTSAEKLEELIDDLRQQLDEQFSAGIEKISAEFQRFFALMFGGGTATLQTVKPTPKRRAAADEADEFTEAEADEPEPAEVSPGIELDVKLPNKRVRGLDMLSGGERALTSIALIFAMSQVNPPLFVILDETDAALDEANSRRYGDMIEALAKQSQLILITHNRETMSRAGILYGVTMSGDGVSKLLSVKLDEAVQVAK
jgi:chromosome segregation protein